MNNEIVFENVDASQIRWYAYWIEGREEPYFTPIIEGFPEDVLAEVFKGADAVKLLPEEVRPFDFRYFAHKGKDEDWDSLLQGLERSIQFREGQSMWYLYIDDDIECSFDFGISNLFEEGMPFSECKSKCEELLAEALNKPYGFNSEQRYMWMSPIDTEITEIEFDYITTIMADRMYHDYAAA